MALTLLTLTDKVRRLMKDDRREMVTDIESAILEGLKAFSRSIIDQPERVALEISANVTLSSADANGVQSGTFPSTIVHESVRDGDVSHADLAKPLQKCLSIGDPQFQYIWSNSVYGRFVISENKLFTRKPSGSFATGTPVIVRGVRLLGATPVVNTELGFVPVALEDRIVDFLFLRITRPG